MLAPHTRFLFLEARKWSARAAQLGQDLGDVGRERGMEFQPLAGCGMPQGKAQSVQRLALQEKMRVVGVAAEFAAR